MALSNERMWLDHVTLTRIERNVEIIEDQIEEIAREVDGIDPEPEYTCDCPCGNIIQDLENEVDALIARVDKLEALVAQQPG